jgi:hypothetical protein
MRTIVGWLTRNPITLTEDELSQLKAVLADGPRGGHRPPWQLSGRAGFERLRKMAPRQ